MSWHSQTSPVFSNILHFGLILIHIAPDMLRAEAAVLHEAVVLTNSLSVVSLATDPCSAPPLSPSCSQSPSPSSLKEAT